MKKKKMMIVFGTRPEAIKMAPVVKQFKKYPGLFDTKVCVTGQHRSMLDQVLNHFEIIPDYDLNIMRSGQDLYDITSSVLLGLKNVLSSENPEIVFVHGDTTTSSAAALAAFYRKIPVAHVEAGLRTNNINSPYPEELNRQIISRIAALHFAPTESARQNLLRENIPADNILVTGNTVIDALNIIVEKVKSEPRLAGEITESIRGLGYNINRLNTRKLILITGHRRENHGEGIISISNAVKHLAEKYKDFDFLYPVHLNPNIHEPVKQILNGIENVFLIEPVDYLQFVYLMSLSYLILTDSGGIQEEAPSLGKPVLVMRDHTERPEAVNAGIVKLVGSSNKKIISQVSLLIEDISEYNRMSKAANPYGDGTASRKIAESFIED